MPKSSTERVTPLEDLEAALDGDQEVRAASVGMLVREAREAAGVSQTELSRRSGVTQPALSAIEACNRTPGLEILARIAEALDRRFVIRFEVLR